MCNSSLQIDNSTAGFEETQKWFLYCICKGHFGTLFLIVNTVLFIFVATPTHCWSLRLFLHRNIKPNMVFPLNFTIVDLVICILSVVSLIASFHFSVESYQLSLFLVVLCWTVRPLIQICMCLEHYLAVIHPVIFLRYKDIQYRIALAAAAWLIGVSNGLRVIFIKPVFPDHIYFLIFCIAVIIISFCCASVLHALKRSGPGDQSNVEMTEKDRHNKTDRGRAAENQQKRRAFKIISRILISILSSYLPQVVTFITFIAEISKETYMCNVFPFCLTITAIVLLISPLINMYIEGHLKCVCFSKRKGHFKRRV